MKYLALKEIHNETEFLNALTDVSAFYSNINTISDIFNNIKILSQR